MKKILFLLLGLSVAAGAFASPAEDRLGEYLQTQRQFIYRQELFNTVRGGHVKALRRILAETDLQVIAAAQDASGNNVLHAAPTKEVFALLWEEMGRQDESLRHSLLAQRNKAGETPLMSHIMYGHEEIFLTYFPQTDLYRRLLKTRDDLRRGGMIAERVAGPMRDELIKECSAGGQTMWQRAYALYQGTSADSYGRMFHHSMRQVLLMIEDTAPFLKPAKAR